MNRLFGIGERPLDFLGIVQYRSFEVESMCLECAVDNAEVPNRGPVIPFAKRYTACWNNTRFYDSANYYSECRGVAITLLDLCAPHWLALTEYIDHGIFVNPSRFLDYQKIVLQACYHKVYRNHQRYGLDVKLFSPFMPIYTFQNFLTDRITFQSAPYAVILDMMVEVFFRNDGISGLDFVIQDGLMMWPEVVCIPSEQTYHLVMKQIYRKRSEDDDYILVLVLRVFQRLSDASGAFRQIVVRCGFVEDFEKMYEVTENDVKKGLLEIFLNILYHCDIKLSDDTATRLAKVLLPDKNSENSFFAQSVVNCLVQLYRFMNSCNDPSMQNKTVATILDAAQNLRGAHWHGTRSVKMYVDLLGGETLHTLMIYAMNQLEDIIAESGDRVKRLLVLEGGVKQLRAIQTSNRSSECVKRADQLLAQIHEIVMNFEKL